MSTSLTRNTESLGIRAEAFDIRSLIERLSRNSRGLGCAIAVALSSISGAANAQAPAPGIRAPYRMPAAINAPVESVRDSTMPLTTAPPSLTQGPVAMDDSTCSAGRSDFFPFEFSRYTFRMDSLWFRRDTSGDQILANGVITATGQAFAIDSETDLDIRSYNPGVRIFFEEAVNDCTSFVNGSFMWFQKMNTGTTLDNNQGVFITRGAGGFGFTNTLRQDVIYDTILYSAEFNYREDFGFFSLTIGPRFLHVEENLQIFERGIFFDQFRGNLLADATRQTFTYNDMIGLQVGFDYNSEIGRFLTVSSFGKAAVMANYSGYRIDQGVSDSVVGPFVRTNRNNTANIAAVVEAGLFANVRLTSHASLRAGYQLLYVPGLTVAPDQFIPDMFGQDTSDVDRKGTGFFYGPFFGLEVRWGLCE